MKLTASEIKLLAKILESKIERFEPEDIIHMIRGPKYHRVLDSIYQDCFRPYIKHGVSIIREGKEAGKVESEVMHAMWDKLSLYLREELDE